MKTQDLIISTLSIMAPVSRELVRNLGYIQYLLEFRFVALRLPRRSGKSAALNSMHRNISSMLFVPYKGLVPSTAKRTGAYSFCEIPTLESNFRGRNSNGLKYRCFLLDEYQMLNSRHYTELAKLLDVLAVGGFLEEDFYLLGVGT
jgi:hypothetical protein